MSKPLYSELSPIDFRRYWENLSDEAKFQAFRILVEYPESVDGDARTYLRKQVLDFKEFYTR